MKITADMNIPFLKGVLEPYADVVYLPGKAITPDVLQDTDALLIRTRTKCNETFLANTHLKFIATATIGMDHIDLKACRDHGVCCVNAPGCNAPSVAQYILSVILSDSIRNGIPFAGKTLGVIGVGHVGTRVAAAAEKIGMKVLLNDPPRARRERGLPFVGLSDLLRDSDIVTLHVPLHQDSQDPTYHLADETFFRGMKRHPLFINASRGEVTDQAALQSALITGQVRAAALDVWENEPDISGELLPMTEFATPHIAGYSTDGKAMGTAMSVRSLAAFFNIPELRNFFPEIPPPPVPSIEPGSLADAVLASYDVARDDAALRAAPESFEALRASYPLRREFGAFRIANAARLPSALTQTLASLGFRM